MGLCLGKHESLLFVALEPECVVTIGEAVNSDWFIELAVSSFFKAEAVDKLFVELVTMKAGASAAAADTVEGIEEKCPAHALRIVALIAAFVKSGNLSLIKEEWLVAFGQEGDLA